MKDCSCGKPVRLGVFRITVAGKGGVSHYIEHRNGTAVCVDGDWQCATMKPYPKNQAEKPSQQMLISWERAVSEANPVETEL